MSDFQISPSSALLQKDNPHRNLWKYRITSPTILPLRTPSYNFLWPALQFVREIANDVLLEFECLWADAISLDSWIDTYTQIYEEQKKVARHLENKNSSFAEKSEWSGGERHRGQGSDYVDPMFRRIYRLNHDALDELYLWLQNLYKTKLNK